MQRKKYSLTDYNKSEPFDDSCVKFFIIYEGVDKEPNYFEAFKNEFLEDKKAYIHHVLENSTPIAGNMPKNLIERAKYFLKNPPKDLKFTPSTTDRFRFVLDVDRHPIKQIKDLKGYSDSLMDSKLFISNFCFEVWLWFHLDSKEKIASSKSKEIKRELGNKQNEFKFNFPHSYITIDCINKAIKNAEIADINKNDYFPVEKSTKVYILMKELLEYSLINKDVNNSEIL